MSCLDSATLWAMDAGELHGDDLSAALGHARTCLACELSRRELVQTRALLSLASVAPTPATKWKTVDASVDDAVMAAATRSFGNGWALKPLWLPAVAAAVVAFLFTRPPPTVNSLAPVAVASVVTTPRQGAVADVAPKDEVTPTRDKNLNPFAPKRFATANGSRFELGRSGVARKVGKSSVQLWSGEAFVVGRKGLVLSVGSAKVRPQGDAVFIASVSPELDVAVAEGAVLVARADGSTVVVHAGERYIRGAVTKSDRAERFNAYGFTVKQKPAEAEPLPSADLLFIHRAQLALKTGKCGDFLLGLETLAFDAEAAAVRASARITKARCHDERLEPDKAAVEYSRYLRDFPEGDAAREARAVLNR